MAVMIKAEKREAVGKNVCRRLRKGGKLPAILYGEGIVNIPLVLNKKDIFAIMKSEARENTIFKIAFDSELRDAMIKALQVDPATDELLHADLIQIALDKPIRVWPSWATSSRPIPTARCGLTPGWPKPAPKLQPAR